LRCGGRRPSALFADRLVLVNVSTGDVVNCNSTWSAMFGGPSTTMVIREIPGSSVVPTARLSMLNPRRRNREETRFRTPGRSSTSAETVCVFVLMYVPSVPVPTA
jgi:hypothetical protein